MFFICEIAAFMNSKLALSENETLNFSVYKKKIGKKVIFCCFQLPKSWNRIYLDMWSLSLFWRGKERLDFINEKLKLKSIIIIKMFA